MENKGVKSSHAEKASPSVSNKLEKPDQTIDKTKNIVDKYGSDKTALIQILLEIQRQNRWLPREALQYVSEKLQIPLSQVYRVATFYTAFSLVPQGRHHVCVCMGTACHVRGSPRLLDNVTTALNITPGETTPDHKFSLSTVNCLGCCALGPVLQIDENYHSGPSGEEVKKIIAGCD